MDISWTHTQTEAVQGYLERHRSILSSQSSNISDLIDNGAPFATWSYIRKQLSKTRQHLDGRCEEETCTDDLLSLREILRFSAALLGIELMLTRVT